MDPRYEQWKNFRPTPRQGQPWNEAKPNPNQNQLVRPVGQPGGNYKQQQPVRKGCCGGRRTE